MNYFTVPGFKYEVRFKRPSDNVNHIITIVLNYYNITFAQALKKCRLRNVVEAKYACYYLLRTKASLTLKEIGNIFHQDHTTVIHGIDKVRDRLEFDEQTRRDIPLLVEQINFG